MSKVLNMNSLFKPNQLIECYSQEDITLIQRKAANVMFKKAQREIKFHRPDDFEEILLDKRYKFEIDCRILKEEAGLGKQDYNEIKSELKKLVKMTMTIDYDDDWDIFTLINQVKRQGGKYVFFLNPQITIALKICNYFTKLNLKQIQKLNCKYSIILYELAKRYMSNNPNIKIPKMTIEEFRKRTNTTNKYKKTTNLRMYVIEKACNEISKKTDIILSYETEKKGRRIAYIKFKAKRKPKEKVKKNKSKTYNQEVLLLFNLLPQDEQIESNKETLANLLKDYKFKYIKADINYIKKINPDNFMGLLVDSCKNDHYGKAELEKKEKKKEQARKKKEEEERKKKAEEKREKQIEELAYTKIEFLSDKEREKIRKRYNFLKEVSKDGIDFTDRPYKMWADKYDFEKYLIKYFKVKVSQSTLKGFD